MLTDEERKKRKDLEEFYKKELKDFAMYYVAIWNALDSLGLNDRQKKGAMSDIFFGANEALNIDKKQKKGDKDECNG